MLYKYVVIPGLFSPLLGDEIFVTLYFLEVIVFETGAELGEYTMNIPHE